MAARRTILTLATGVALTIGWAPMASAGPDRVDARAASILATATAGEPVTVVTTTQTSTGPTFTTTVADSRGEALDVITAELDKPSTADVDVSHTMSIAATEPTATATTGTASTVTAAKKGKRTNDTYRRRQWSLDRLDAERVWHKSSGKGVVVAVVDTGVYAKHPDLKGRVLKGRDFVEGDRSADDRNGHGTHVAGVIAARADNGRGIAGLAKSSRILPVRVLNSAGSGNTVTVARGIVWAVNKGADVINLSLAGEQPDASVEAAVKYAVGRNVVVVAAAGNRGCAAPTTYPAAYPGVIAVGAINHYGSVSSYSNCGAYVDVVAPGTSIRSTMIRRSSSSLQCRYGKDYCMLSGTSMASPHVAAAAAIIIARTRHRLAAAAVGDLITSRADDIVTPGFDTTSGFGVLNVNRSLIGR